MNCGGLGSACLALIFSTSSSADGLPDELWWIGLCLPGLDLFNHCVQDFAILCLVVDPGSKTKDVDVSLVLVEVNNFTTLIWCTNEVVSQVERDLRGAVLLLLPVATNDHVHKCGRGLLHGGV